MIDSEFEGWMWCSVGYSPEDAAKGICPDFWKFPFGCQDCKKWKLMTEEEILKNGGTKVA